MSATCSESVIHIILKKKRMTERDIYFTPRKGREVLAASPPGTRLYLYSDLASDPRQPLDVLLSMGRNNIILLQDPDKMNSGHWIALSIHPETREVYFFSTYGGMPDREKIKWLSSADLMRSGQKRNVLNDALKELAMLGWTIYYNDYPYQVEGDNTATCGIWSAAFLNSGMNPDQFEAYHYPLPKYYYTLFK